VVYNAIVTTSLSSPLFVGVSLIDYVIRVSQLQCRVARFDSAMLSLKAAVAAAAATVAIYVLTDIYGAAAR